jgi:hypothetical protein
MINIAMANNSSLKLSFKEYYMLSESSALNKIQTALDVAGFEPTIGTGADALNVIISGLRAAYSKTTDERKKHTINAGISAISLIPFADIIKILKLRKSKPLARYAISGAKNLKTTGQTLKSTNRFGVSENEKLQ